MKTTTTFKNLFLIQMSLPLLMLSACSQGGLSASTASLIASPQNSLSGGGGAADPGAIAPPAVNPLDTVDMKSFVDDSNNKLGFNNIVAFDIDKVRGEFVITLPMPSGFLFTPSGSFNKYPDITFSPIIDASGSMRIGVRVPIKYVIKGLAFVPATRLPNGDPLPAMPAGQGELPSLALSFPVQDKTQITLYIGINALGFYVTLPEKEALPIPINITLPIKNKDKSKTFGYLSYVNTKNGFPPGLFLSTGVPASFARILEDSFGLN